jgi:hypothetical protein
LSARPDPEHTVYDCHPRQLGNAIDGYQTRRSRHAECHGWYQALAAGEDATIPRPPLCEQHKGFINRGQGMIGE